MQEMQFKDGVTLVLSLLALGVSIFTLWWSNFRRRVALFFVQTFPWRYALVNGGKTDILLTSVRYWVVGENPHMATSSARQKTGVDEGSPVLLKAGTAVEHGLEWEVDFEDFFRFAREVPADPNRRVLTVQLHISWVDNDGMQLEAKFLSATVELTRTRFLTWVPMLDRMDLKAISRHNPIQKAGW